MNSFVIDSVLQYFVDQYKVDPNNFYYEWQYDAFNDTSLMSQVYIDLGNYLAGKLANSQVEMRWMYRLLLLIMHFFSLVVGLTQSFITRKAVENPNGLKADLPNNKFKCFTNIEVISSTHASIILRLL